ncbi:TPA: IS66 family insertion sequence element accessory protein TnpB [Escherichia coli]|nr:IS66 family insertion sequence element accessory protein TnpB [Escherichia coli]HDZ4064568.1 IS66 family insertion sequence element accessory protein TnpB [Escherichia coli]
MIWHPPPITVWHHNRSRFGMLPIIDWHPASHSGNLFIFRGRRGDTIKILWADADGLCLFTKRLEEGQFIWPAVREGAKFWLNVLTELKTAV